MTIGQQNLYLRNNDSGQLKELKKKTILTFKTSDSTEVTGRIISITDSLFEVETYIRHATSDTVEIRISTVEQVTNKLMNKKAIGSAIFGYIGLMGLITSPFLLITDSPEDAKGLLEVSVVFLGISAITYSPHLIKRKFNTKEDWALDPK